MALKAVAIDESLGEAHRTLAFLIWLSDGDSAGAERELRRAVELMPSNAEIHIGYAIFLGCMGRRSESIAETLYGLDLNPTALLPNQAAAWIYLNNRRPVQAERQARRAIEAFPHALHPYFVLGWAAWCQGRAEEAVAMFEKAVGISREVLSLSFLGHVYARLGRTDDARRLLSEIEQHRVRSYAPPIAFVVIYAGLGALDEAFQWCNTACRLRDDITWLLGEFPGIDPLRSDPRFAELIHSIETSSR
jgi:Flp pilus assembly protein TadD